MYTSDQNKIHVKILHYILFYSSTRGSVPSCIAHQPLEVSLPFLPLLILSLILRIQELKREGNKHQLWTIHCFCSFKRQCTTLHMVHLSVNSQFHWTRFLQHIQQRVSVVILSKLHSYQLCPEKKYFTPS